MTEQQIDAAVKEMTPLLADALRDQLALAHGPKTIQISRRQRISLEALKHVDRLVAEAASDIGAYLSAWPNVDHLISQSDVPAHAHSIRHTDQILKHATAPGLGVYYAATPIETGLIEASVSWTHRIHDNELAFHVTCAVAVRDINSVED